MVSWPESSCSSSDTLKHTFLLPPWSALSTSLSSLTGGEDEVSSTMGGSQGAADVGSVMVDSSLPERGKGLEVRTQATRAPPHRLTKGFSSLHSESEGKLPSSLSPTGNSTDAQRGLLLEPATEPVYPEDNRFHHCSQPAGHDFRMPQTALSPGSHIRYPTYQMFINFIVGVTTK